MHRQNCLVSMSHSSSACRYQSFGDWVAAMESAFGCNKNLMKLTSIVEEVGMKVGALHEDEYVILRMCGLAYKQLGETLANIEAPACAKTYMQDAHDKLKSADDEAKKGVLAALEKKAEVSKDCIHAKATAEDVGMWATKTSNNVLWQQLVKRFDESLALHDISAIEKGMQEYVANRELYAWGMQDFWHRRE